MSQIDRYKEPIAIDFAPVRAGELAVVDDTQLAMAHLDLVIKENPGIEDWMNDSSDVVALWHETKAEVQEIMPPAINTFSVDWDAVEHHLATNHHINLQIDNSYTDNSTYDSHDLAYADNSYYSGTDSHDITSYSYDDRQYTSFDDYSVVYEQNTEVSYEVDRTDVYAPVYAPVENHYHVDNNTSFDYDYQGSGCGGECGHGYYIYTENHTHIKADGLIWFYVGALVMILAVCAAGLRDWFYTGSPLAPVEAIREVQPWQ